MACNYPISYSTSGLHWPNSPHTWLAITPSTTPSVACNGTIAPTHGLQCPISYTKRCLQWHNSPPCFACNGPKSFSTLSLAPLALLGLLAPLESSPSSSSPSRSPRGASASRSPSASERQGLVAIPSHAWSNGSHFTAQGRWEPPLLPPSGVKGAAAHFTPQTAPNPAQASLSGCSPIAERIYA